MRIGYLQVGSGQVINNGTNINACCVRSNSLRKLEAERANEREVRSFPYPTFPCLLLFFLLLLFPHLLLATAKESQECISSLAGLGGAWPPNDI